MSIPVKIISGTESGTIKKGNFAFGISNTRTYGPTSETGFYKGHTIPDGGYVVYLDRGTASPSAYVCGNDSDLISIVNSVSGGSYQTVADAVSWVNTQSGAVAFDKPFGSIVTDGLVLNLDAGSLISYSGTGSTWYDVSGVGNNGTLTNGPTFNFNGFLEFDGIDDSISISSYTFGNGNWSVSIWANGNIISSTGYGNTLLSNSNSGPVSLVLGFNSNKIFCRNYSGVWNNNLGNTTLSTGKWYMLTWVNYAGASANLGTMQMFVNGISDSSIFNSYTTNGGPCNTFARFVNTFFSGRITKSHFYNRSLSVSEILQNYYQAPIVTDGLVFAVDAGNLVSYENGSTTVYNLSGTQSGTLINGVGYSKNKGGSWVFDGINDRIQTNFSISGIEATISISVSANEQTGNGYYIAQSAGGGDGSGRFIISTSTDRKNFGLRIGNNTLEAIGKYNEFFILTVRRESNGLTTFYKNNEIVGTFTNTTPFVSDRIIDIGGSTFISNRTINGSIGNVLIYNRALSQEEIQQNFEAQRQRFGI